MTNTTATSLGERTCAAAWKAVHWRADMPTFAHEVEWDGEWPAGYEEFRETFRMICEAASVLSEQAGVKKAIIEAIALLDVAISGTTFTRPRTGQIIVNIARAEKVLEGLRQAVEGLSAISPPLDRGRADLPSAEEVARIIDPYAFTHDLEADAWTADQRQAIVQARNYARAKARAILSLIEKGR